MAAGTGAPTRCGEVARGIGGGGGAVVPIPIQAGKERSEAWGRRRRGDGVKDGGERSGEAVPGGGERWASGSTGSGPIPIRIGGGEKGIEGEWGREWVDG